MLRATSHRIASALLVSCATLFAAAASAQPWPDAQVRIVVPYRPGTGPDVLARELADRLSKNGGHPVVVENRDGANGIIGTDLVAKAAGDGRTLLVVDSLSLPVNPHIVRKVPFDWRRDLKSAAPLADVDLFLYTGAKRGFRSIADLVGFARANPGVLNFGVVGNGSVSHLSVERLMAHERISMTKVNYNGIAQVIPALVTGEIDAFVLGPAPFVGHVADGRVRALVAGADDRARVFPDVPTLKEAGLPAGLFIGTRFALYAPGTTPDALVTRINAAVTAVAAQTDFRERFTRAGLTVVTGDAAAEAKRLEELAGPVEALVKSLNLPLD
jgi:tripartite-type tricarboxylate transporter receptor subunit TctC